MHVSQQIAARADEIAHLITAENGKPLMWSRSEVTRGASTFRWAAEEARRWSGELQRLDTDAGAAGRMAVVRRFPNGPVLGVAPFNFPLNLVAHKVALALAVGARIIVKPAPATPLTALLLGEILSETDLPAGMWSVLPLANEQTAALVADPRLPVVSFTGSETVGYHIQSSQPTKHVILNSAGTPPRSSCRTGPATPTSIGRRPASPRSATTRPDNPACPCRGSSSTSRCTSASCRFWSRR